MNFWQQSFILIYGFLNFIVFLKGFYESKYRRNAFGLVYPLSVLGMFVWGDAVVFGLFWVLIAVASLLINNWYLFLLILSVFWVVRSFGETIYWFNQQYSSINRNPIKNLPGHSIFHDHSIWFVHQIVWQCVTVISLICSLFFGWHWLRTI